MSLTVDEVETPSFLSGGGELGRLMRRYDWASSPLGPPASWPQSLKSAVSICLGTKFPIGIYWGEDLALLYNDAWAPIPGNKHPDALGRPGREVWPEIWEDIGPLFAKVQQTGEGVWQQDQLLPMRRHGYTEECYFNFTFSPIRGEQGAVEGIFNAVVETTFRVIGERRERALRHIAETVAAARTETEVFAAAAKAIEAHSEDLPFCLIYSETDGSGVAELAAAAGFDGQAPRRLQAVEVEGPDTVWPFSEMRARSGHLLIEDVGSGTGLSLSGRPWPEPVATALAMQLPVGISGGARVYFIAGISPRRALDHEYSTFVDRAAGHIAAGLANARAYEEERRRAEALAELDRAKTLFFSNVSHEFRTPLTLMMGPIEDALAETGEEALGGLQRERLESAMRNSMRLLKLVNALLDFSRIEAGRTQASFAPTDIGAMTEDIASNFRSAVEKAGLRLSIDVGKLSQPAYVDRDLWEKVLLNLLSNAFKFTFAGEISVAVREVDGGVETVVADTGVGVPAEELPRLFDRFHRVEGQKSRSFEGSGIGLALVKELVRLHGGEISASSEVGAGTAFRIFLPYGSDHLPAGPVGAERGPVSSAVRAETYVQEALRWLPDAGPMVSVEQAPAADDRTILIADDNADMRDYLRRLLSARWRVVVTADGAEALEAVRVRQPDLVITDVMMPRLDGFGLLRALRDDPGLSDTPVIMLSARAGEESRIEGLGAGADDYLVKPFSARELLARVTANLELRRIRKELTREVRESEARFRNMADHAPMMVWVTEPDGNCSFLSKSWYDFTGQTPATGLGAGWLSAVHPDDRENTEREFRTANREQRAFKLEYRLRSKSGDYIWAIDAASPRFGPKGEFCGYVGSVLDISERKKAEERTETLLREVNHRSKNMLSLVQAVARHTTAHSPKDFLDRFSRRLQSLAASQDLLVSTQWRGVDLGDLVRSQLAHFSDLIGSRILVDGPAGVKLTASTAQLLGMALHELGTNAGKYGALSTGAGRVEISWTVVRDSGRGRFSMQWRERNGPLVTPPERTGFGSNLINQVLKAALGGAVTIDFRPEGLVWRLECDDDRALEDAGQAPERPAIAPPPAQPDSAPSHRRSVLVVEDDPLVAMDVAATLESAGYHVLGPAGTVEEAIELIDRFRCDYGVLDVNLGRQTAEPVAARLQALGIPFLSLSGYAKSQQPAAFQSAPALSKPLRPELLLAELQHGLAAKQEDSLRAGVDGGGSPEGQRASSLARSSS